MKIITHRKIVAVVSLVLFIAALVLECLPSAQTLTFSVSTSSGEMGFTYIHYHYFDLTPVGFASFTPFLTGLLTIAGIILFGINIFYPSTISWSSTSISFYIKIESIGIYSKYILSLYDRHVQS